MGQETIGDASNNNNNKPVEPELPVNPNDPTLAEMEAWGGAMLRAITGDETLQWSGQTLYAGTMPQVLPAAHHTNVPVALVDQRGMLDSVGLRLRLSDQELHRTHLPGDPIERMVFELLEQLRVER